jgi:hypothetical protein
VAVVVRVLWALSLVLLPFATPGRAAGQATPGAGPGGEQYTPVLASVFAPPAWFAGTDGRVHLVYELVLTNAFPVPATVTAVEVYDGDGAVVVGLDRDALSAAMSALTGGALAGNAIPPSSVAVVWFDLPLPDEAAIPAEISHRVTISVPPGLPVPSTIVSTGAPATVDRRPPVVLAPPLAGPRWVAVGSCCDGPHRRSVQPIDGGLYLSQRFAIDFNQLDAEDRFSRGDPARNASYPTYGQPVFAVADATVVAAVDRFPDQVAGQTVGVTLENADGNHVVLDLGEGRFAFYAHLKPGSVRVAAGDAVRRGEQIGEAGNSGSSDGPHLHFHVMDGPSALAADGMPYVFDAFAYTGKIPPLSEAMAFYEAQQPVPIAGAGAGERRDELPLGGDVVAFPDPNAP